jgi:glutamate-1-semialdehyde 2,1-aminomutase
MNEVMEWNNVMLAGASAAALTVTALRMKQRLELSLAKHRSLAGHPRIAKRISSWLPHYRYSSEDALKIDGAPASVVAQRQAALQALRTQFKQRYPKTWEAGAQVMDDLSDMQFIQAYRVPFQFQALAEQGLKIGSFLQSSHGVQVTDLDGNRFYDLTGSYGVNLFGYDFYKACIDEGSAMVRDLGPVLGAYHPVMADTVARLKKISGMDEMTFHMSGTEAVMQAVRLARYHTGRSKIVRFCGSYHGWWGDVQPGIGNPVRELDTLTLQDLGEASLRVLRNRNDVACVLINPLQALHPNRPAPGDSTLLSSARKAHFDREAYTEWLKKLRLVCDAKGIALIFDEVFLGFRLAPGGAQAYFGVGADLVTYGKTLGGGLPVGVLCGTSHWMRRFRDDIPADICFARGTFNAHPYVIGAMNAFLRKLESADIQALYQDMDTRWNLRANLLNQRLKAAGVPVKVAAMGTVWTVLYSQPACFNWLFQHYLRLEGLALSWVGTGRIIFSLNYTDQDFEAVCERFVRAAQAFQADGWWWKSPELSNQSIQRRILKESIYAKLKFSK